MSSGAGSVGRMTRWILVACLVIGIVGTAPVLANTINGNADVFPNFLCGVNPPLGSLYPAGTFTSIERIETDADGIVPGWNDFGDFKIFAYFVDGEFMSFDWTSSKPIGAVLVKGATCYWVYEYFPGATSGNGLTAPGGAIHAVSHADFGFLSIPEFPVMACGLLGVLGVMGMVYFQRSRKE